MQTISTAAIWTEWYAWHPVLPLDDEIFWLEIIYRRRHPEGFWEYRSFRPEAERCLCVASRPLIPGA